MLRPTLLPIMAMVIITARIAHADQWEFFYPQTVSTYGCRVSSVESRPIGGEVWQMAWSATAWAKRSDKQLGDWEMNLGRFPATSKGRHQAEKLCSKWQDEAEQKVRR